jgi:hypothetical protein
MDSAKGFVAGANLDEVGARAAETASNLYRGGRELLAGNEDLSKAAENLSAAVRTNPLAAVGIAFSAGGSSRFLLAVKRNAKRHRRSGQQYAQEKAQTPAKRIAVPAAFGLVAALLFLSVVIPLFAALFFWLTSLFSPMTAALVRRGGRLDPRALAPAATGRWPTAGVVTPRSKRQRLSSRRCWRRQRHRSR